MSKKKIINPKLSVVGAGPGDPDLITVKAIKALSEADVVLYDALIDPELLKFAPYSSKKIFVGKRKGKHSYSQDQINDLIIDLAFTYGHVVRLKGGDPFVFGRGSEETLHAEKFNIETDYVPGISSSFAVAGLQKIPVTHRGTSDSVWIITGTTSSGDIPKDLELAARSSATVVVLMGLSKLKEIAEFFSLYRGPGLPAAVISKGSTAGENAVFGNAANIYGLAADEKIAAPAILIFGDVVELRKKRNNNEYHLDYLLN